ncbi:hypothetical protein F0U59_31955 [Archangium gephyra]|nr:hypothetical protein F0U59_31955 [Archangium gephyra]
MFVLAAVFTVALPLAQAQEATSDVSTSSVVSSEPPPTCRPPELGQLSCTQHCMVNGYYPNCGYCDTPCPPTCRPANQGPLSCVQSCMLNNYPSCDYCNTPCS